FVVQLSACLPCRYVARSAPSSRVPSAPPRGGDQRKYLVANAILRHSATLARGSVADAADRDAAPVRHAVARHLPRRRDRRNRLCRRLVGSRRRVRRPERTCWLLKARRLRSPCPVT